MTKVITPKATFLSSSRIELQFPFDGAFVEMLKREIPAACRSWDPVRRVWTISADDQYWASLAVDLLVSRFPRARVAREANRETGGNDPYRSLHLLPTAPPELVKSAYRTLSKLNHPDHGGDTAAMQAINAAYAALATQLEGDAR
ncbi:MAG: J domain-containing protein [Thermomicrobiales bacterium]|nr:J domain-containing protein [Thermomicrobiales bacterium]